MPSAVVGFAFTVYPVRDLARAVAFYRDRIGLRPAETFGDEIVEFTVGNATFAIDTNAVAEPGTQCSAAFEIAGLDDLHASLVAHGVAVAEIMDFPPCRMAIVTDPDGNRFTIHERKAKASVAG